MTLAEKIYDIIRTGIGNDDTNTSEFKKIFNKDACSFVSDYGKSLLQKALTSKKYDIAKFLIENECNLKHQDKEGFTALHYILSSKIEEMVKLADMLIEKMDDIDIEDSYGNTPLWYAVKNPKISLEIIKKLLEKGADPYHKNNVGKTPLDVVKRLNIPELNEIFKPYIKE